jgi:hypothetical protein
VKDLKKVYPKQMKKIDDAKKKDNKWMQKAVKNPGSLSKELHVSEEKNIPASKLTVKPSDSPLMARRKRLAAIFKRY